MGMEVCGEVEVEVVTNCDVEGIAAYDLMSVGRGIQTGRDEGIGSFDDELGAAEADEARGP